MIDDLEENYEIVLFAMEYSAADDWFTTIKQIIVKSDLECTELNRKWKLWPLYATIRRSFRRTKNIETFRS